MNYVLYPNWLDGRTYVSVMVPLYTWIGSGLGAERVCTGYMQMWRVEP